MTDDKVTTRRTSEERRQQIAAAAVTCLTLHGYAGLTARRAEGLAERPRTGAAAFLDLGLGTAEKVPIRATKPSPLQCETPPVLRSVGKLSVNYRHILFGTFRLACC